MTNPKPKPIPFRQWLAANGACEDARDFVGAQTLKQAWTECNRPEWMLWLLDRIGYDDQQTLRLYACWCAANTPLPDGRKTWGLLTDDRPRKAILAAIDFANGEATKDELAAARDAAWDAAWGAAWAAWDAAGDAAWATAKAAAGDAAWGAAKVAARDAAGGAARAAAWAAKVAAGDAAWDAAWDAQAKELRRRIPTTILYRLARKAGIEVS